jgi:SAM-dependent methyltransferase
MESGTLPETSFTAGAAYYDAIYRARGKDYAAEVDYVRRLIQEHKCSAGNRLLEVACGTGRHTEHLVRHFQVTGLDKDHGMLNIARERLPDVSFQNGDMTNFRLAGHFDAVICLFSSIGYVRTLQALREAICSMADHLVPGGILAVEPWMAPADFQAGKPFATYVNEPDLKVARMNVNVMRDRMSILDFHYLVCTGEGVKHFSEHHELGLFTDNEYRSAFIDSGLETRFDPPGIVSRGLYVGVRPVS